MIVTVESPEGVLQYEIEPSELSIDMGNITPDLCKIGERMLYYGAVEAQLRAEVAQKEARLEKLRADLDTAVRADAENRTEKMTEAKVAYRIVAADSYQALLDSLRHSKQNLNVMRWMMIALQKKTDILISLAYRERQLMRADTY